MTTQTSRPPLVLSPFVWLVKAPQRLFLFLTKTDSLLVMIITSITLVGILVGTPILWVNKVVNTHSLSSMSTIVKVVETSSMNSQKELSQKNIKYYVPENETFRWGITGTKENYCIGGLDTNSTGGIAYYDSTSKAISWDGDRKGLCLTQPPVKFTNGVPSKSIFGIN